MARKAISRALAAMKRVRIMARGQQRYEKQMRTAVLIPRWVIGFVTVPVIAAWLYDGLFMGPPLRAPIRGTGHRVVGFLVTIGASGCASMLGYFMRARAAGKAPARRTPEA